MGPVAQRDPGSDLTMSLLALGIDDIDLYVRQRVVAAAIDTANITAMYSTIPPHSCPLAVNLATNAILQYQDPNQRGYSIEVINHPLSSSWRKIYESANTTFSELTPYVIGVLLSIGLSLLAASFIVMPVEERNCQVKQLQLMTGVNPYVYWGTSFLWDYSLMLICVCIMTACLPIFERYEAFTNHGGAGKN